MSDNASMWRSASAPAVAEMLFSQNGGAKALRIARLELQKARRARSRKRFEFWAAVERQMEASLGGACEDRTRTK